MRSAYAVCALLTLPWRLLLRLLSWNRRAQRLMAKTSGMKAILSPLQILRQLQRERARQAPSVKPIHPPARHSRHRRRHLKIYLKVLVRVSLALARLYLRRRSRRPIFSPSA